MAIYSFLVVEKRANQKANVQQRLGRSVGRRDRASIARQVVADRKLLMKTVPLIGKAMAREMLALRPLKNSLT